MKTGFKIDFMRNKNLSRDKFLYQELSNVLQKYLDRKIKFDEIWLIYLQTL